MSTKTEPGQAAEIRTRSGTFMNFAILALYSSAIFVCLAVLFFGVLILVKGGIWMWIAIAVSIGLAYVSPWLVLLLYLGHRKSQTSAKP